MSDVLEECRFQWSSSLHLTVSRAGFGCLSLSIVRPSVLHASKFSVSPLFLFGSSFGSVTALLDRCIRPLLSFSLLVRDYKTLNLKPQILDPSLNLCVHGRSEPAEAFNLLSSLLLEAPHHCTCLSLAAEAARRIRKTNLAFSLLLKSLQSVNPTQDPVVHLRCGELAFQRGSVCTLNPKPCTLCPSFSNTITEEGPQSQRVGNSFCLHAL